MASAMENISPGAIVAVGDVSVATLIDMGVIPDIAMVDGMTKRTELDEKVDLSMFDIQLTANNPAGQITPSLIESIEKALHNDQTTCIDVNGEEDLAPIIVHMLAPIGTNVVYGQPGNGVVLTITNLKTKNRCRDLLSQFEWKLTLVSIAVCVRNGKDWINGCMESLVNQTHKTTEIILVDDGSTDGGREIVKKWASHDNVITILQEAKGLSSGRMAALEIAKGD